MRREKVSKTFGRGDDCATPPRLDRRPSGSAKIHIDERGEQDDDHTSDEHDVDGLSSVHSHPPVGVL